jgi:guanylate kinase
VAVISEAEAAALRTSGGLLAAQTVMGHTYGIRAASVQQLQAEGRLALLDLDRVEQARGLKAAGFKVGGGVWVCGCGRGGRMVLY